MPEATWRRAAITFVALLLAATTAGHGLAAAVDVTPSGDAAILQKAVIANSRDWKSQNDFCHTEQEIKSKIDSDGHLEDRSSKTFEVLMIDGSPYDRLIALNKEPLSPAQQQNEQAKLNREITTRRTQSPSARRARIGKYKSDRADEHLLMQQMVTAFDFKLMGEENVSGVECYKFLATPKPDYNPPVEKARVLRGMRGQMWIEKSEYHWVKVQAEVTQPVSFGFFIAKVNPGTRFELDQAPVGGFWLPKHFIQTVHASVFGIYGYRNQDETFYSDYRPVEGSLAVQAALH